MKLSTPLSLLLMSCVISSCASPTPKPQPAPLIPIAATDDRAACLVWKPLLFSRMHDTVETIEQAKVLNAAHDAYCGAR